MAQVHAANGKTDAAGAAPLGDDVAKPAIDDASSCSLLALCQDPAVTESEISRVALLDADAATARDDNGATSLHHICANSSVTPALIETVGRVIAQETREAVTTRSTHGFYCIPELGMPQTPGTTPLLILVGNPSATPACLAAAHALDPSATTKLNGIGSNPMHALGYAAHRGRPSADEQIAMIRACHALDPEQIKVKHNWKYTPLHMMCWAQNWEFMWTMHSQTIAEMFALWPGAMRETDNEGRTPLLTICARGARLEMIKAVAAMDPVVTTESGLTPLHFACYAGDATPASLRAAAQQSAAINADAARVLDVSGRTPLDCLSAKDDPQICAALCAALPLDAFTMLRGQKTPLLHSACRTEEGALEALEAMCRAHTSGVSNTTLAVDPAILPRLLLLTGASLEHAACTPCIKALVDSVNARPGPLAVLLLELELNVLLCVLYFFFADSVRRPTGGANSEAFAALGIAAIALCTLVRKVTQLVTMRRLGMLAHYASDPFVWIEWLAVVWVAITLVIGRVHVARRTNGGDGDGARIDVVCAWGALVLAVKLLAFLRQLSVQLARFVRALLMIVRDIASFLVVLVIAVMGFGQALYFLLAPRATDDDGDGDDDDARGGDDTPYQSHSETLVSMVALLLGRSWSFSSTALCVF